jgi:YidC/Oxa1 family membrane protein insertase
MDKKIFIALGLSLATVWAFNYYTAKKIQPEESGMVSVNQGAQQISPGQPVKVPTSQELYKPLSLDVSFADRKITEKEEIIEVKTDYCSATLSSYGAILTSLDFNDHLGKSGAPLRTVYNKGAFEKENRKKGCFLLALDEETPYVYSFLGKQEIAQNIEVAFKADSDHWTIYKTYIFHKEQHQVDLELRFDPKGSDVPALKPRLFFAAPVLSELDSTYQPKSSYGPKAEGVLRKSDDTITMFAWNESKKSVEKSELNQTQGLAWFWANSKPLFGAEDRYFVHALVKDPARFVQRAYVKQFDEKNVYPILEGPVLTATKSDWKMSFYMGPKLSDHMAPVDDRLEDVLSFGWLSWLCKILLKLLAYINSFVGNYGFAIIIMTILLKLPFTPLSIYSRKQMERYQYYMPSINKIRMKYRHDMQMQQAELMKFYHDHNISPTTQIIGCLPLLIQMPILFALYRVLNNYLDLYQAPFIGWIVDLSAKDPYYVIPVLMGISMIWQQSMAPSSDEKQRVIMWFMSIAMTVVFANFPVGLVLYWFLNNVLTIGEDYLRKFLFK